MVARREVDLIVLVEIKINLFANMECIKKIVILLSVLCEFSAKPVENIETTMLRRRMDNDNAASYVYRSDNNGPAHVYYLTGDDLNKNFHRRSSPLVYYESSPLTYSHPYAAAYPTRIPTTYYPPKAKNDFRALPFKPSPLIATYDESHEDFLNKKNARSSEESGENESKSNSSADKSEEFSAEGGQSHEDKYEKKKGNKLNNGYSSEFKFQKGKKGSYDTDHDSGDESEHGEKKASKYDEADNHSEHHSEDGHKKGGKYGHKKHHKKGSKSKGYHNVYMKDEYKKDHTFYGELCSLQTSN